VGLSAASPYLLSLVSLQANAAAPHHFGIHHCDKRPCYLRLLLGFCPANATSSPPRDQPPPLLRCPAAPLTSSSHPNLHLSSSTSGSPVHSHACRARRHTVALLRHEISPKVEFLHASFLGVVQACLLGHMLNFADWAVIFW
jgi:hypothetical protein